MDHFRDYGQDTELAKQFFRDVTYVDTNGEVQSKYGRLLTEIANRERVHLLIEVADIELFNEELARHVVGNTHRYTQIFYDALDQTLPAYKTRDPGDRDPMDVFIEQRLLIAERNQRANPNTNSDASQATPGASGGVPNIDGRYPPDLIRRAEITFKPSSLQTIPIREVKAARIGKLITVRGIVTRTTDVKPRITVATYTCDQCGCETFQPITTLDFTPLDICSSAQCKANKVLGKMTLQTRGSKFVKCQEIKLQEHSDQVPTGHIPRTITVTVYGELTRSCAPGDHISVSGVFLPVERSGYRMGGGGSTTETHIETHYITRMNKTEDDELNLDPMTPEEAEQLIRGENNFLAKLSSSIAPEIYGHEELKKALLLLLVGGVDRNPHGMKIRGNINICLMGDPGVAKSQLLSFIDRLASRSQYTTGRGSSGVGLTAAVLRDPITNELVLEGGALVLADEGICCIDEFDKMMDADRTAIHEVMEQQTVSIAKAGIMTTLNARVSILAAANPAYGRYNTNKSITDNLDLPPALLSRFDLIWLIKDIPDLQKDLNLAHHITYIHSHPDEQPPCDYDNIDMKVMRRYISLCKRKNPVIPEELGGRLVQIYLDIRARKRTNIKEDVLFTSPRSLLALIRISTAFARLRLADVVEGPDIDAAVDLYNCSRDSINGAVGGLSIEGEILLLMKEMCTNDDKTISRKEVIETCKSLNFTEFMVDSALSQFVEDDILAVRGDEIIFID